MAERVPLLDLTSEDQYTPEILEDLYDRADEFQNPHAIAEAGDKLKDLYSDIGKLAVYFWFEEPSTRTAGSFDAARELLGLGYLGERNAKLASSSAKGEILRDSMRTSKAHLKKFGGAVVVIRHPQVGSAADAAAIHDFPVINAGDGQGKHPTQAGLDFYTFRRRHGRTNNLIIGMGGDPRYSRTIHSLAEVAVMSGDNELRFIGGKGLWIDDDTRDMLKKRNVDFTETTDMSALKEADVVYWTRLQKERLPKPNSLNPVRRWRINRANERLWREYVDNYVLSDQALDMIKSDAGIYHPLPRGPEIPESIDSDPRVGYFEQMENSVPFRAALLERVLIDYHNFKLAA
jgi:aspartate carbamoyltransferase catalytic subunit